MKCKPKYLEFNSTDVTQYLEKKNIYLPDIILCFSSLSDIRGFLGIVLLGLKIKVNKYQLT